jgi:hypothetical protein
MTINVFKKIEHHTLAVEDVTLKMEGRVLLNSHDHQNALTHIQPDGRTSGDGVFREHLYTVSSAPLRLNRASVFNGEADTGVDCKHVHTMALPCHF